MRAHLIAGLVFGDEGKGTMTDYICSHHRASLVVRYNGGPQAAHNVYLPDGKHHTFAQFGSGSLLSGWRATYLSRFMLIEPYAMLNELKALDDIGYGHLLDRMFIDQYAVIITPWHWMANRLKERARGNYRHGSCGFGIGEARGDEEEGMAFRVADIKSPSMIGLLHAIRQKKLDDCLSVSETSPATRMLYSQMQDETPEDTAEFYSKWYDRVHVVDISFLDKYKNQDVVFEGAQGVLLDQEYGFFPYVSRTNCTFENAYLILEDAGFKYEATRIGVVRTYFTRHGPGPFITEQPYGQMLVPIPDKWEKNVENDWQGTFRTGNFDGVALRYALKVIGGVDYLAVTHLDRYAKSSGWLYCDEYRGEDNKTFKDINETVRGNSKPILTVSDSPIHGIQEITEIPIGYKSWGPTRTEKECNLEGFEK